MIHIKTVTILSSGTPSFGAQTPLIIGRYGENNFTPICFDVSVWLKEYPNGAITIVYCRPDGYLYPVITGAIASPIVWTPTSTDLAAVGIGAIELRLMSGNVVGKSAKLKTNVEESLGYIESTPGIPEQHWIDTVAEHAANAAHSAIDAKCSQDSSAESANQASIYAENAQNNANSALISENNATTSANTATENANFAIDGATNAQISAAAAGTSETNAANTLSVVENIAEQVNSDKIEVEANKTIVLGGVNSVEENLFLVQDAKSDVEFAKNIVVSARDAAVSAKDEAVNARNGAATDKSEVDVLINNFIGNTIPSALQSVEDKADKKIEDIESAGVAQVVVVESAGATQISLATNQANRAESEANEAETHKEDSEVAKTYAQQALSDLLAMLGKDVATLINGKLNPAQLPDLSINDVFSVANTGAMLTLNAQRGDCALIVVNDTVSDSYLLAADDPTVLTNWKKLGVSYVANAGHATTADEAANATTINNHRVVAMTQDQYDSAVKDPDTIYLVG